MHAFVYGSRLIENEQQISLERHAKRFGSWLSAIVRFFVAPFSFVGLNALLFNLAHHTNPFSANNCISLLRFLEEATRVLFVDNAFTTSSLMCQFAAGLVAGLVVCCVAEIGFVLRTLGVGAGERNGNDGDDRDNDRQVNAVICFNTVSYKQKVCFLS